MFQKLKTLCWGGPNIVPRPDWIKTGLIFHDPEQCNAFGLKALKGATKSFQLILGMSKWFLTSTCFSTAIKLLKMMGNLFSIHFDTGFAEAYILKHLLFESKSSKKAAK